MVEGSDVLRGFPSVDHYSYMQDPIIFTHRELRAALHLAERELKRITLTPRRVRLLTIVRRTLDSAKHAAVTAGISKMPNKDGETTARLKN